MTPKLEQDTGPPKVTPLALDARTGQNVDWLDDKPSLSPVSPKRKRVHFRDRFVGSLTAELEFWLTSILAVQSQRSQSATLGGTLLAMQLVRRTQFRRRRSSQSDHKHAQRSRRRSELSQCAAPDSTTMKTFTVCSVFIDVLDPALIRKDKDGRRHLDFVLARSGEIVQSVPPGRIKGQRTLPCGEWRLVELTQESELQTWSSNGGSNSLAVALAHAYDHERPGGSRH